MSNGTGSDEAVDIMAMGDIAVDKPPGCWRWPCLNVGKKRADNLIVQLDSSIYTMIFIPVEGAEMPADGRKFLKQCYLYYDLTMKGIDDVLALATPEQLTAAEAIASKIALPGFLFKEFKGDFYRPATP